MCQRSNQSCKQRFTEKENEKKRIKFLQRENVMRKYMEGGGEKENVNGENVIKKFILLNLKNLSRNINNIKI